MGESGPAYQVAIFLLLVLKVLWEIRPGILHIAGVPGGEILINRSRLKRIGDIYVCRWRGGLAYIWHSILWMMGAHLSGVTHLTWPPLTWLPTTDEWWLGLWPKHIQPMSGGKSKNHRVIDVLQRVIWKNVLKENNVLAIINVQVIALPVSFVTLAIAHHTVFLFFLCFTFPQCAINNSL